MTAPLVSTLTSEPIVGRYYMVPCVRLDVRPYWRPVIGPEHDDAEIIKFPARHLHYDARFLSMGDIEEMNPYADDPRPAVILGCVVNAVCIREGPTPRRLKCVRKMPTYPREIYEDRLKGPTWPAALENAYADVQLKPGCLTCPHRGLPLNGLPVKDGVVQCSGHGLCWDLKTGKMVRRASVETSR